MYIDVGILSILYVFVDNCLDSVCQGLRRVRYLYADISANTTSRVSAQLLRLSPCCAVIYKAVGLPNNEYSPMQ